MIKRFMERFMFTPLGLTSAVCALGAWIIMTFLQEGFTVRKELICLSIILFTLSIICAGISYWKKEPHALYYWVFPWSVFYIPETTKIGTINLTVIIMGLLILGLQGKSLKHLEELHTWKKNLQKAKNKNNNETDHQIFD